MTKQGVKPRGRFDRALHNALVALFITIDMVFCVYLGAILGASGVFLMPF